MRPLDEDLEQIELGGGQLQECTASRLSSRPVMSSTMSSKP